MNRTLDSQRYLEKSFIFDDDPQYDKSIVLCKRALTTEPNYYNAHFKWGRNLMSRKAFDKSTKKHKEIICRDPENSVAHHNLGIIYEEQNKLFEAEIHYKKSLESCSSYQGAAQHLTIVLTKQAKYKEAIEQFEQNIKKSPDDGYIHNCYGYLKFMLGKYEEAIKSFEEAIQKDQQYSIPYINKSLALHCLGKPELAIEELKKALDQLALLRDRQERHEKNLLIYQKELSRLEELSHRDDFGEISREQLEKNIKALHFIVDLLLNQQQFKEAS